MALSILDGNQSATTLSTILSSGQHITAHTVVSLGTQAITDMRGAVSGSVVSISNFPSTQTIAGTVTVGASSVTFNAYVGQRGDGTWSPISLQTGSNYVNTNVLNSVTIGSLPALPAGTEQIGSVTASISGTVPISISSVTVGNSVTIGSIPPIQWSNANSGNAPTTVNQNAPLPVQLYTGAVPSSVTIGATIANSVTIGSLPAISGTVTANLANVVTTDIFWNVPAIKITGGNGYGIDIAGLDTNSNRSIFQEGGGVPVYPRDDAGFKAPFPVAGTVTIGSALPAGTNRIGVVTIGAGTVTIGAGTAQIGSVTASISNSVTIASFATSVTARLINPAGTAVTYAELGTAGNPSIDVLSVQGVTSGTPLNVYPMQGTTVSNTNFTSVTASTTLVSAVTMRESLTVFNEGAGNLHISPGATCTTISYQVRLSAGDYWECPAGQLSLGHVAVFATAGTARVCQVS